MENLDLENKMVIIGKASFNIASLKGLTKEEFIETYKGLLDAKAAWKQIAKYAKVDKVKVKTSSKD